ncbi:MAG: hypothetical protein LHW41_07860 [Candidatus Cloacimonetes bacterium]|nr:hypothetical protein [Candidatus Cloacimonadota bacterium]
MKKFILLICILALSLGLFAEEMVIGTGTETQRYPLGSYFGYERSAALYTAAEIGIAMTNAQNIKLVQVGWLATLETTASVPTKIYLKTTNTPTLVNGTWANMISGATLVYNATRTGTTPDAWNAYTFSTTFNLNRNDHLMILVERNFGGTGSSAAGGAYQGGQILASSVPGKHLVWNGDSTVPTSNGSAENFRPNVYLQYTPVATITNFPFTEGFEVDNTDQSSNIKNWAQITGHQYISRSWTANRTAGDYNRLPKAGFWNAFLAYNGQSTLIRPVQMTAGKFYGIRLYARQDGTDTSAAEITVKCGTEGTLAGLNQTIIARTGLSNGDYQSFYGTFIPPSTGIYYIGIEGWINSIPWYISLDAITIEERDWDTTIRTFPFYESFETGNAFGSFYVNNWNQVPGPEYMDGSWMPSTNTLTYNNTPRTGAWNVRMRLESQAFLTRKIELTAGKAYSLEFFARQDGSNPANAKVLAKFGTTPTTMTETIVAQAGLTNGDYQRFYGVFTPQSTGDYYIGIQGWINNNAWYISMDDITIAELPPAPSIASFPFFEGFETENTDQSTMIKDWAQIDGPTYSGQFWTASNNGEFYNTAPRTGNWNAILRYSGQSTLFRRIELIAGKIYSVELYARQDGDNSANARIQVQYGSLPTLAGMDRTIIASRGLTSGNYQKISGTFTAAATGVFYIGIQGLINNTPWRISLDDITIDIVPPITSLPFRENFDTGHTNMLPPQDWGQITGPQHTGKEWLINQGEIANNREPRSGTFNATLMWNGQSCMYRPIHLTSGKTYFIEFYARQDGTNPADATLQVKFGSQPTLAAMNLSIIAETGLVAGDYQRFYGIFTPWATSTYYIGIQGWINSNPWFISLDDIIIDELAPAITSLPFVEGFETGNTHGSTVIKNWNQTFGPDYSIRNWRANSTYTDYNRAPRTGTWNTFLLYNGDTSLTRRIQLTAGKAYSFELYARQDTDNPANAKIQVLYGVDGSLIDQTIIAQTGLTNGNYQRFFGTFTASSTDTYYIAIHGWANHLVQYISLDDITIAELATPIASFPFRESFELENTDQSTTIKNWFQEVGPDYTGRKWTANSSLTDHNRGPRSSVWNATLQYDGHSALIRPIELIAGKTYYMRLFARQDGPNAANATIKVKYGREGSLASMTQNIIPITGLTHGDYQDLYGTFSPTSSGIYYIGIQGWINNVPWYISLDDIIIDELPLPITSFPFVESFEVGNTDQSSTIKDWMQATGPDYLYKYWTANSSETIFNRTPRTGNFNSSLAWEGQSCLIRPMELAADTEYFIEFYARQNSNVPGDATIQVKYGSHGSIGAMT